MRKNILALSIAAMVGGLSAGAANAAVFVNTVGANAAALGLPAITAGAPLANTLRPTTSGIGHVLIVPYFTTQDSNKTLLSITNTDTDNAKAVKLRFRGAANSDDVFDITVFLSPGDMWTADVGSDDGVISRIATEDTSCTLPSIKDIKDLGGKFKLNRVQDENPAQTREGYVEILNMADIPAGSALFTAVKHVNGVAPCTPAEMDKQENELVAVAGDKNSPLVRGYSWPTGGLYANWIIVNTATTASFSGEAVALRAVPTVGNTAQLDGNGSGNLVWFPQTSLAIAAGSNVADYTADPLLNSSGFVSKVANYDFPDLSTPYTTTEAAPVRLVTPREQANELANALATKSVVNDFLTANGFGTDWVFSMPTRRYAVALNYAASGADRLVWSDKANHAYFNERNTGLSKDGTQACVTPGGQRAFDREESTRSSFVISPDTGLTFCGETSVLSFNNLGKTSVLGAKIARKDINTTYADGWFNINTAGSAATNGLPIIGFAAANSKGINLGGTWNHRTSR